jgi:hypothetical protein
MLIALNSNNVRILPSKGTKGLCPLCRGIVVAVCGEINIHHWRHDTKTNCDPWKESETDWHRKWKEKFPKEWREFIITQNDEKHIADIRTNTGLIVEFQNSPISSTVIQIRELFYEKMIWVINANIFKDNFSIRSIVKSKLRENEHRYNAYLSHNLNIDEKVKEFEKEIRENDRDLKSNESKINWVTKKIEDLEKHFSNFEDSISKIINTAYLYGDFGDFKSDYISQIKKCKADIDKLDEEKKPLTAIISKINNLQSCQIPNYEKYKYVPFEEVSSTSHAKCKLVFKETINSFFPKVISIDSESNFRWFSKQPDKYLLIIDLYEDLSQLDLKLKTIQEKIESLEILKNEFYLSLEKQMQNWLKEQIDIEKQNLENLETEKIELQNLSADLAYEKEYAIKEMTEDNLQIEKGIEEERKIKEIEIKRNFKGQYAFNWKHRRKNWDYAECPIYLDFETHIFSIETDNVLRKMNLDEFIKMIVNWK